MPTIQEVSAAKAHIEKLHREKARCDANATTLTNTLMKDITTGFKGGQKFLFELLQNADDAALDDRPSIVRLRLITDGNRQHLIFSHSGKHFSETDVERIADNAQQRNFDKSIDPHKIGFKGIGFKALFSVADRIDIFSNAYTFRFDKNFANWQIASEGAAFPWPIIPIWTEAHELSCAKILPSLDSSEVNFIASIKPGVDIQKDLLSFLKNPEMLLFLRSISRVELAIGNDVHRIEVTERDDGITSIMVNRQASLWQVSTYICPIPEDMQTKLKRMSSYECPERLKAAIDTTITFVAPIEQTSNGIKFKNCNSSLLYCALPTMVQTRLPYIINAPFLLDPERSHLQDSVWNQFLLMQAAYIQFNWFADLSKNELLRDKLLYLLHMPGGAIDAQYSESLTRGFNQGIDDIAFLPSAHNPSQLLKVKEALVDRTGFYEVLRTQIDVPLNLVRTQLENHEKLFYLPNNLRSQGFNFTNLTEALPRFARENKSVDFQKHLFNYLKAKCSRQNHFSYQPPLELSNLAFVLTQSNEIVPPSAIYLPNPKRADIPLLPENIEVSYLHPELLSDAAWLESLGTRRADAIGIFRGALLKFINDRKVNAENIVKVTRFIFSVYKERLIGATEFRQLNRMQVLTGSGKLILPRTAYLSQDYQPFMNIEDKISADEASNILIVRDYMQSDDNPQMWRDFFCELGVGNDICFQMIDCDLPAAEQIAGRSIAAYFEYLRANKIVLPDSSRDLLLKYFMSFTLMRYFAINHDITRIIYSTLITKYAELKNLLVRNNPSCVVKNENGSEQTYRLHSYGGQGHNSYLEYLLTNTACVPVCGRQELMRAPDVYWSNFRDLGHHLPILDCDESLTGEQAKFFGLKTTLTFDDALRLLVYFNQNWDELLRNQELTINHYAFILEQLVSLNLNAEQRVRLQQANINLPMQKSLMLSAPSKLHVFRAQSENQRAPFRGDYWVFDFSRLPRETFNKIVNLFNIPIINTVSFNHEGVKKADDVLQHLISRLPLIAVVESEDLPPSAFKSGANPIKETLCKLTEKLGGLKLYCATNLTYAFGDVNEPCFAHLDKDKLYFKQAWDSQMTIDAFCKLVSSYLGVQAQTANDLRQMLVIPDDRQKDWLETKGLSPDSLFTVESTLAENDDEESSSLSLVHNTNPPKPTTLLTTTSVQSVVTKKFVPEAKPEIINYANVACQKISYASRQPRELNLSQLEASVISSTPPAGTAAISSSNAAPSKNTTNEVSSQDKVAIGRWGEEFVYNYLEHHYKNKYPRCILVEAPTGFSILGMDNNNHNLNIEVLWHNKNGESYQPVDFTIKRWRATTQSEVLKKDTRYVEVKATISDTRNTINVSANEYSLLQEAGDRYRFFRVYSAGTDDARLEKVKNPDKLIREGKLTVAKLELGL